MKLNDFEEQLISLIKQAHDSKLDRAAIVGCLELCKLTWVLPTFFAMHEAGMRDKKKTPE